MAADADDAAELSAGSLPNQVRPVTGTSRFGERVHAVDDLLSEVFVVYSRTLKKLLVEFLSAVTIWILLFLFHRLAERLPVQGWAARSILHAEEVGAVLTAVILIFYFLIDMIQASKLGESKDASVR